MKNFYVQLRRLVLTFIDWLTQKNGVRITVNDIKLNVPGRYLRYFAANYEEENFAFLKGRIQPGMTCLDIGGHIGVYAVYMAKVSAAKVFSFEPTPTSFHTLKKMISLNGYENVISAIQAAVAEKSGSNIFYLNKSRIPGGDSTRIAEVNSLANIDHGKNIIKEKLEVITYSIDDFAEKNNLKIDFIKIDTEGSELGILKGAKKTILKDRPSGILGIHTFAYADKDKELLEIWNTINEYNLRLIYNNKEITKNKFLTTSNKGLLDLQFCPV